MSHRLLDRVPGVEDTLINPFQLLLDLSGPVYRLLVTDLLNSRLAVL